MKSKTFPTNTFLRYEYATIHEKCTGPKAHHGKVRLIIKNNVKVELFTDDFSAASPDFPFQEGGGSYSAMGTTSPCGGTLGGTEFLDPLP